MSVEISFGGVCRDIDLLPKDEADLIVFFDKFVTPMVRDNFINNWHMTRGQQPDLNGQRGIELETRGCEIGGSVSIKF